MKYVLLIVIAGAILLAMQPSSATAQPKFSGYFEHTLQVDYAKRANTETILDVSKLRLDIGAGGGEGMFEFRGNLNYIQYHTRVSYDITPYLPEDLVNTFRLAGLPTTFPLDESRFYLDNAFFAINKDHLRFRAGKQQLSWGTGYSFNPTDLFHKKTLVDPTYEKEGVTALRLDLRWGVGGQLTAIMAPAQTFDQSGYAIRLGTHADAISYDVAITAHRMVDSTKVDPLAFSPLVQRREALGLEFSGPLLGLGFWFEGNYNWMEKEDDFLRAVSGLDYTLENGLYVMAEGMINMRGQWEPPYTVQDWLSYLVYGEPVGRGWVLAGISKDLTSLTSGALYVFSGYDGGVMINPRFSWSVAQNADAEFFGAVTTGPDDGAFPPGLYSGFARVTVYF
ncbi:MAG: hypothetical protein V2A56_03175 [bacterium]